MWEIPPERASRVGHPAPFPVELPARLIELYTYRGDLVLDPFLGAGSTAVAAVRSGRHYVGYDTEPSYVALAEARVADERLRLRGGSGGGGAPGPVVVGRPAAPATDDDADGTHAGLVAGGRSAKEIARRLIESAGFTDIAVGPRQPGGLTVDFAARDPKGRAGCSTWRGGSPATVPASSGRTCSGRPSAGPPCSGRGTMPPSWSSRPASRRRRARGRRPSGA